jgi:hypothetical protein
LSNFVGLNPRSIPKLNSTVPQHLSKYALVDTRSDRVAASGTRIGSIWPAVKPQALLSRSTQLAKKSFIRHQFTFFSGIHEIVHKTPLLQPTWGCHTQDQISCFGNTLCALKQDRVSWHKFGE